MLADLTPFQMDNALEVGKALIGARQ